MKAQVVLYVTPGCGLCEMAREALRTLGIEFQEASDARYLLRVPVVEVNGTVLAEGRIETAPLRRAFRRHLRTLGSR